MTETMSSYFLLQDRLSAYLSIQLCVCREVLGWLTPTHFLLQGRPTILFVALRNGLLITYIRSVFYPTCGWPKSWKVTSIHDRSLMKLIAFVINLYWIGIKMILKSVIPWMVHVRTLKLSTIKVKTHNSFIVNFL